MGADAPTEESVAPVAVVVGGVQVTVRLNAVQKGALVVVQLVPLAVLVTAILFGFAYPQLDCDWEGWFEG